MRPETFHGKFWLLAELGKPGVEEGHAPGLDGGEGNAHAGRFAAKGNPALSDEHGSFMGNAHGDLRSRDEGGHGFDKTAEQAEVFGVSGDMGVALEGSHLHSGHEGEPSGAMAWSGDGEHLDRFGRLVILWHAVRMSTGTGNVGHQ